MTANDLRVRLAEAVAFDQWVIIKQGLYYRENACGYTGSIKEAWKLPLVEAKKYEMYADRTDVPGNEKVLIERAPMPEYCNSLDAIATARTAICTTPERRRDFVAALSIALGISPETAHHNEYYWAFSLLDATAEQQARALVAVLGEGDANL